MRGISITELIDFTIHDNYIQTPKYDIYMFRYYPPNTNILTQPELYNIVVQMQRALDSINGGFSIFIADKVENLNENKEFYKSLDKKYYHLTSDIIKNIESDEVTSTSVQKAHYFVVQTKDKEDAQSVFNNLRAMNFTIEMCDKKEMTLLIRNYLTREFLNTDIFMLENEISEEFEAKISKNKQTKKNKEKKQAYFKSELTKRLCPLQFDYYPRYAQQGDLYRQTIMVKNIPSSTDLCRLRELAKIKNTTFHMRMSAMNEHLMRQLVNNQMNNKKVQGASKNKVTQSIDAEIDSEDIINFYKGVSRNKNKIYHTNIYLEIYGKSKDELKDTRVKVTDTLRGLSITYEPLVHYQREGFLSASLFGKDMFHNNANNLPSNTLASLYPCSYSSRNDKRGMLLGKTRDGGNMFIDFFLRDLSITNGNFSISGQSGQGKSWLMKKIFSQQVMRGTTCFAFDPEDEYIDVTLKLGGTRIDCSSGKIKINPFEVRRINTEYDDIASDSDSPEAFKHAETFFQHLSWLKDFFRVLFPEIRYKELDALMILVQDVYKEHSIDERTDFDSLEEKDYPIFSDVYEYLEKCLINFDDKKYIMITKDILSNLILILKDCYSGALGFLFNGYTNIKNYNMICFSLNALLAGERNRTEAVLFNILTYCWNRIAMRNSEILLFLDEFELLISSITGNYIKDFTKRARKYNSIIGTATQNITPLMRDEIKHICSGIYANTAFKFIFHPGDIDFESTKELLQLTDGEADIIRTPKQRDCLVKAGGEKYVMTVGTLPYENYLFGTKGGK